MISLPNFAEFAESVNSEEELTEKNYCDQQPVTMEFTFEEHDLLNSILCHASDSMDLAIPCVFDLSEDSEIRQRYEMLSRMRTYSYSLWATRFGN
jgi:CRISPR/Cas system-associated endonuclease/helicase Cas3